MAGQVRRRRVFYLPGFDPVGPRKYRELYRREMAAQAALSGGSVEIAAGPGRGAWTAVAEVEGARVQAEVAVLEWADIVRAEMAGSVWRAYAGLVRTAWIYVSSGALFRLMRLRKGPMIAAAYPPVLMLVQLGSAVAAAALLWLALAALSPWIAPVALAVVPLALRLFRHLDRHVYAWYLMQTYAFCAGAWGATPAVLAPRLAAFADRIAEALADPEVDEVLVVGHSAGAHLAVTVLADLLRAGRVPERGPALALLTLGQVIPMVSFLPRATRLRADLAHLAVDTRLTWVDITAPGDGACFALCDPVAVSGVAPPGRRWPLVLSCAFTQTLAPETWARLKRRYFRLHFQYLHAFDRPGAYDYLRVTAGPLTLAARFGDRSPSASRIERPLSGHTACAA